MDSIWQSAAEVKRGIPMKTTRMIYIQLFFFALIIFTTGCAKLDKSYPERKYYVFDVTPNVSASVPIPNSVLKIRRFRVSPAYHGNGFVYRISSDGYESDFYNQFFKSPSSLITQVVYKWASKSSPFEYVVEAPSEVTPDFILDGVINAIYGDYSASGSPKAILRIQIFLLIEVAAKREIVFSKTYREETDISSKSPTALMNGWNAALKAILTDLGSDLRKLNLTASN